MYGLRALTSSVVSRHWSWYRIFTYAYSRFTLWSLLWVAVWFDLWGHHALIVFNFNRDAAIFPVGLTMMFELAAYGALTGLLYRKFNLNIYIALIGSMLAGRIVSGLASTLFYGMAGKEYGLQLFLTGAFVTSIPGIILQIIIIPLLVIALEKGRVVTQPIKLSA
ncbi:Uncharacterised protein [Acetobacterium wieringae]|nr:Uncharacterised protein [Acetobacterium wieringae]